jgi:hypothetical protein
LELRVRDAPAFRRLHEGELDSCGGHLRPIDDAVVVRNVDTFDLIMRIKRSRFCGHVLPRLNSIVLQAIPLQRVGRRDEFIAFVEQAGGFG